MQAAQAAAEQLNRGDVRGASMTIEQGLRNSPNHPDLLHLGGQAALYQGDVSRGRELIRRAIKVAPKIALYHYNLGNVLFAGGDLDGALKCFRQAVRIDPGFVDAFTNLGIIFAKLKKHAEAEAAFDTAARLQPDNPKLQLNLAICNMELREPEKVERAVARLESLLAQPDAALLHELGNIYRGLGRRPVAEDYYRRALQLEPDASEVWYALGDVLSQGGSHAQAFEALEKAVSLGFEAAPVKTALARVSTNRGNIRDARTLLAAAFDAAGDNIAYILKIAYEYTLIGDFQAQEQCLEAVLRLDPENAGAIAGLVIAPGRKVTEEEVHRLDKVANDKNVEASTRSGIGFALGDFFRHAKKYDDSFRYYRLGNRLKGYSFDQAGYAEWVSQMTTMFSAEFFSDRADWGSDSRMPVLIVGMPRSGTTLIEQILSSHPSVFGAGEYGVLSALAGVAELPDPDFVAHPELAASMSGEVVARHAESYLAKMQALAQQGERFVTNKLPHNFEQLGLFGMLFPDAPVIHIKRDPRDNLLSVYFQDFAAIHDYAYDLKSLGRYYRLYERLMAHWLKVIPNPVYSLQYEDLVADLPGKAREVADFIGVEWDERMLRFHEQERMVQTASKWQVRQPLYTSSIERWKPYEQHLKPLFEALGPVDD